MRKIKQHSRVVPDTAVLLLAEGERRARQKIFGVMLAMEGGGPGRDALAKAAEKYQAAHKKVDAALKKEKNSARIAIIEELHRRGLV